MVGREKWGIKFMATDKTGFESYLSQLDERVWAESLARILPRIHPVDREATQIWFAFWPLKLSLALGRSKDPRQVAKDLQLDGKPRLEQQVDTSVVFLFGSKYWPEVKQAVVAYAEDASEPETVGLDVHILGLSRRLAAKLNVEQALLAGITAVGVMVLRQVGVSSLTKCAGEPALDGSQKSAAELLKSRRAGAGFWKSLFGKAKRHRVTFDEKNSASFYEALEGQDLSMASGNDQRDFRELDHRRIAGPVPVQCRSAACGYCWIGILSGREHLSEVTDFEKSRLEYFGYAPSKEKSEKHPLVRLACQSKCYGDVSILVPPWNGVLQARALAALEGAGD